VISVCDTGYQKSTWEQIIEGKIEEIRAHTISLKAKEVTNYIWC
jgi:hypothetical protein